MSAFRDLMSIVDPTAAKTSTAPKQPAAAGGLKPVSRPAGGVNGSSQAPQLKRKASGPVESTQVKIQRKEGASQPSQTNDAGRLPPTPTAARPNPPAPISTVPYRGTAAPASAKSASPVVRRPVSTTTSSILPKAAASTVKPATTASTPSTSSTAAPKKGYLALLQKAKEKDTTKPVAPPGKQEPAKILTRKERLALKAEASAVAKGKKPAAGLPGRPTDGKGDPSKEKRKPVEVGYQGTARPAKKPVEVGYKGTARPTSAPASSSRSGTPATKAKPNPAKGRYDGYADWDELDDMDDEEDDYASDASSDMEGGIWDVEEEEDLALKVAKKEDAEALAEEMALKRAKEERKRKLLAMSKAAAAKRKY